MPLIMAAASGRSTSILTNASSTSERAADAEGHHLEAELAGVVGPLLVDVAYLAANLGELRLDPPHRFVAAELVGNLNGELRHEF